MVPQVHLHPVHAVRRVDQFQPARVRLAEGRTVPEQDDAGGISGHRDLDLQVGAAPRHDAARRDAVSVLTGAELESLRHGRGADH